MPQMESHVMTNDELIQEWNNIQEERTQLITALRINHEESEVLFRTINERMKKMGEVLGKLDKLGPAVEEIDKGVNDLIAGVSATVTEAIKELEMIKKD